jgi:serine/threonine protein phosphatase PrpC
MPSNHQVLLHSLEEVVYGIIDWNDYRIGYFICKNKAKSEQNEDALFLLTGEDHLVFGVADGAGGHPKGQEAAFIVGDEVIRFFKKKPADDVKMLEVIESINDKVIDLKVGAYTTLAMATINQDNLRSFSVGDSEVIYWNGHGNEIYSNIPHTDVGYRIEAGVLPQDESLDHPERHSVNNLIGDSSIRIEVASKMSVKKGHTILVGSDGLFDNLSHQELSDIAARGSFEKSFEQLRELCLKQDPKYWKKDDDISFVLVRKIKT